MQYEEHEDTNVQKTSLDLIIILQRLWEKHGINQQSVKS
jgi:hypothetical protein